MGTWQNIRDNIVTNGMIELSSSMTVAADGALLVEQNTISMWQAWLKICSLWKQKLESVRLSACTASSVASTST
jgi:hypothetical protein